MRFLISGVAFSGNKGAAGMAEALIRNLAERDSEAYFLVFSYYPIADAELRIPERVKILDGSPKRVVLLFFASLLAGFGRLLHLPRRWYARGEMGEIAGCDLWLDASGISFVDGREKFLIFNILSIFPALSCGVPVIKVAQAMGPFQHRINRWAAKLVLPRLKLIVARGAVTRSYLDSLELKNIADGSDVAFSLPVSEQDRRDSLRWLPEATGAVIAVSPSQVVWNFCERARIPYLEILADCVKGWIAAGYRCVVFPHSARTGKQALHNNDLPVLRRFAGLLPVSERIRVIDSELGAGELRALIGNCQLLVASRFHAIISAMATGVPAVVIGWSHKYAEVLAPFELEEFVVPYDELSEDAVRQRAAKLLSDQVKFSRRIRACSASIVAENARMFDRLIQEAALSRSRGRR